MDVKTVEETVRSSKSLVRSLLGAGALIATVGRGTAVVRAGDLLTTVVSVLLGGLACLPSGAALFAVACPAATTEDTSGLLPTASPSTMLPHAGAPVTTSRAGKGIG